VLNSAATRQNLYPSSPLVFINACRSAGTAPEYTRMMGWAQQFMAAGAGAFVGTLWLARSSGASAFATSFYDSLCRGDTLAEATLRARQTDAKNHDDPTWLAYTIYGDPGRHPPPLNPEPTPGRHLQRRPRTGSPGGRGAAHPQRHGHQHRRREAGVQAAVHRDDPQDRFPR
jgi:hypothetical protein